MSPRSLPFRVSIGDNERRVNVMADQPQPQPQQQQSASSEPEKGELPGIRSRVSSRSPMSVEALPAQMESPSASSPSQRDEMMACVVALEAALLPCLPARELQAVDRSVHSSHQSRSPLLFFLC